MWLFNQSSSAARTALIYITAGAFIVIWTGVWFVHLYNNPPETNNVIYWCTGFLVTGLTLAFIGLVVGRMSQSAQQVGLPPEGIPIAVVNLQPNVAAAVPVVAPANLPAPIVVPNGQGQFPLPQGVAGQVLEAKGSLRANPM